MRVGTADGCHRLAAQDGGCAQDGLHRLDVAGAAAKIARKRIAHLHLGRVGIAFEQRIRGKYHTWRAKAALDRARIDEGFL